MSKGVLSGFPTCGLGAGLSWTESPFLLCGGGVSAWVLVLSLCAPFDLLVVEGLVHPQEGGEKNVGNNHFFLSCYWFRIGKLDGDGFLVGFRMLKFNLA